MSCHGSRRTPLFDFSLAHVINFDDEGRRPDADAFHAKAELFVRLWKWEFEAGFERQRNRRRFSFVKGYLIGVPFLGIFTWQAPESYPVHQYSGDFTERLDARRLGR